MFLILTISSIIALILLLYYIASKRMQNNMLYGIPAAFKISSMSNEEISALKEYYGLLRRRDLVSINKLIEIKPSDIGIAVKVNSHTNAKLSLNVAIENIGNGSIFILPLKLKMTNLPYNNNGKIIINLSLGEILLDAPYLKILKPYDKYTKIFELENVPLGQISGTLVFGSPSFGRIEQGAISWDSKTIKTIDF